MEPEDIFFILLGAAIFVFMLGLAIVMVVVITRV